MTITPTDPGQVTKGSRIRVAGSYHSVRAVSRCTVPAEDGGTIPAVAYELDTHETYTVPAGLLVDVVGKPAGAR